MIGTKLCSKCKQQKPLSDFYARKSAKDGRQSECKQCNSERHKKFYLEHIDQYRETHARYHRNNYEKMRQKALEYAHSEQGIKRRKEYYESHKAERREYERKYREKNKSKRRELQRRYYYANKDRASTWKKRYRDSHRGQLSEAGKKYRSEHRNEINRKHIERLHNDPIFKLKEQTRNLIRNSFKRTGYKKNSKTEKILGCDFDTLTNYLFGTWKSNYGTEWNGEPYHIDHIIPLATAKTEQDVIELCHYTNLQLLSPEDNLKKNDSII
jgi:hypothetical protein